MTKKEHAMLRSYTRAMKEGKHELRDVYKTWSTAKERAFRNCRADMEWHGGTCLVITSANTSHFSCAFYYYDNEYHKHLRYHTRDNVYDFEI